MVKWEFAVKELELPYIYNIHIEIDSNESIIFFFFCVEYVCVCVCVKKGVWKLSCETDKENLECTTTIFVFNWNNGNG